MWYGILKEFNCKVTSSWSSCGRDREMDFTHRHFGKEVEGRTVQLGFIFGLRRTSDKAYMHNDFKTWDSWDLSPIYAITQENEASHHFSARSRRKKGPK